MTEHKIVKTPQLLEVWESFSGWYWLITEYCGEGIMFGLVRGHETEWGYINLRELTRLQRSHKVWRVPRDHWALCPCVINDDAVHAQQVKGGGEPWNNEHKCNGLAKDTGRRGRRAGNRGCCNKAHLRVRE